MNNHPLFEGFIGSDLLHRAGSKLGFSICVVRSLKPIYPMTPESADLVRTRLKANGGPDGFYRVACWQAPGLYLVAFAKPLTAVALACYLVGLGSVAQARHSERGPHYRYSHCRSNGIKGWADTRSKAAELGERDAFEHGQTAYKTHQVGSPLASWLYSGAEVLEDLRQAAYQAVGDESQDWPALIADQTGQFAEAHALLVDGFAWHTENTPTFSICNGPVSEHEVRSVRGD